MFYKLMLITNRNQQPLDRYLDFIKYCADGGITSLQLREKSLTQNELIDMGHQLIEILSPYKIPLVINDSVDLAIKLGVDHVHIGQQDDSIVTSLESIPYIKLGVSIESLANLELANQFNNLAYVTASAVFPTKNKQNLQTFWGLKGVQELAKRTHIPLTAIGGITLDNVSDVIRSGAKGIALIGAIHDAADPYKATKEFRQTLDILLEY